MENKPILFAGSALPTSFASLKDSSFATPAPCCRATPKTHAAFRRRRNGRARSNVFANLQGSNFDMSKPTVQAASAAKSSRQAGTPLPSSDQDTDKKHHFRIDVSRIQCDPAETLRAFIKTRGSLVPEEEFVFWFVGDIYGVIEDGGDQHLFAFEGYNIGRMVPCEGGWRMLTREVGVYRDPKTREILGSTWTNPYTGKECDVVHVWNDPVNQEFLEHHPKRGPFKVPCTIAGGDIFWNAELSLSYPSPIPASQFPEKARSDTYRSFEMFQFFSKCDELESDHPSAKECQISWVRMGQWLPWMNMADRPGQLVYHCRGKRLANGYADLAEDVRRLVEDGRNEYAYAPREFTLPNETSWTYFKKLLMSKGSPRADGTIAKPEVIAAVESAAEITSPRVQGRDKAVSAGDGSSGVSVGPGGQKSGHVMVVTREYLSKFDGSDPAKPLYLSIGGVVFDVSTGQRHYRRGETYNNLVGRDATHAFLSGDLSDASVRRKFSGALEELTPAQRKDLDQWVAFFAKRYACIGRLDFSS